MEAKKRVAELLAEGLTHIAIPAILKEEGYVTPDGKDFSAPDILELVGDGNKAKTTEVKDAISVSSERGFMQSLEDLGIPELTMPYEISGGWGQLPEVWKAEIRAMIRAELADALVKQTSAKSGPVAFPVPGPKLKGRHDRRVQPGTRIKFGTSIDANLFNEIEKWRSKRSLTLGKALDIMFREFFDRPALSFEQTDNPESPKK